MTKKLPKIRISYSWLLSGQASEIMNEKYGDGTPLRTFEEYEAVVEKYDKWWSPFGEDILNGLCNILQLEYRQNIIDIYVAPWFSPISNPMVIGPAYHSMNALINTITHELIHRLLIDNTSINYKHDLLTDWKILFGDNHDFNTLVHIPVHAVMKRLYLDVIDRPDLLKLDIDDVSNNKPYAQAWDYVNNNDYVDIIGKLKISKSSKLDQ
jgi:hypothetical protein